MYTIPLLALCALPLSLLLHPTHYTLGLYILLIALSRSSGVTLSFELGLLWKLVRIGYFISGLIRMDHALSLLISCHSHIPCFCFSKKKKKNVEKKEKKCWKKKRRKKKREVVNKVFGMGVRQ